MLRLSTLPNPPASLQALTLSVTKLSNQKSRAPFKPKSSSRGTSSYQLRQYAEATLGAGSLRQAVKLPEGEDLCEWIAVNGMLSIRELGLDGKRSCGLRVSQAVSWPSTRGISCRLLQPDQLAGMSHERGGEGLWKVMEGSRADVVYWGCSMDPSQSSARQWRVLRWRPRMSTAPLYFYSILLAAELDSCWRGVRWYRFEYLWQDSDKYKRPTKMAAPDYIEHLMSWVQSNIDNEQVFPSRIGISPSPQLHQVLQHCTNES